MIREHILAYLKEPDPGRMLLIAAPAGIGKTTLAVEIAELWAFGVLGMADSHGRVLYVGPRKEFIDDIRPISAKGQRIAPAHFDRFWYPWQGHHGGDTNGLGATCRWDRQIRQWMERGYGAMGFCEQPRVCGWNYVNHQCPYHRQRERTEPIIFAQYEHVSMGHPLLKQCNLVIGDELPTRGFLFTTREQPGWIIPPHAVVPPGMPPGPFEALFRALHACTRIPNRDSITWHGETLINALGGPEHVIATCAHIPDEALPINPEVRSPDAIDDVPYFHVLATAGLLRREAEALRDGRPQIVRVHVTTDGLHLLLRRAPANLPEHVIWLDATANARMYETLFRRPVEVVRPDAQLTGRIFQMWASLNNKAQFLPGKKDTPQHSAADAKVVHIRQQIDRILVRGYRDPGYIGHKGIIDRLVPDGTPAERIGHFGGNRGTNRFEHVDCLIIVGAPQPTTAAMLDIAAMLYGERDAAFDATWSVRDVVFEGLDKAYPIGGFWNDPDLQTLLEQFRDAEMVQAIHRARPLRNQVDIWLLANVPLAGLPVELVSLHALFGATDHAGRDLKVKDPYQWPRVVAWADAQPGQIAAPDLMRTFDISAPTARKWLDALVAGGQWRFVSLIGQRPGPIGRAVVKCFNTNPN